jgi:hypothetical protein
VRLALRRLMERLLTRLLIAIRTAARDCHRRGSDDGAVTKWVLPLSE